MYLYIIRIKEKIFLKRGVLIPHFNDICIYSFRVLKQTNKYQK